MKKTNTKLPAPRLQLRWERSSDDATEWLCHYELVLPLRKTDIRREVYDENGDMIDTLSEFVVAMGVPTRRSSPNEPCTVGEERFADAPFRNGAHSQWDSAILGNIPVYVIAPDDETFLYKA